MAGGQGIAYRMYEEYYARAREADQKGQMAEAKKMYLHASEELFRAARDVQGETRRSLMQRAEKLIAIAHPDFRDELIKKAEQQHIWLPSNKR